jgi:hypothetical protein
MIIEPHSGDAEDDASSTKKRSLLAIAGSLLGEINLLKLALAWIILAGLPSLLLGLAPLVVTGWLTKFSNKVAALTSLAPLLLLAPIIIFGWFGVRPLVRAAERSFWSLNSLLVQPFYAVCRESLRHVVERLFLRDVTEDRRAKFRAATAFFAGVITCTAAAGVAALAWPSTQWSGEFADLANPLRLLVPALANTVVLMGGYLAVASLAWGLSDASMDQPRDLVAFDEVSPSAARWRVAHLSDVHVVGERYGFRIESGRAGPRGNHRFDRVLEALVRLHEEDPLDLILITGDMTDAGRSPEWAEFLDAMARHPELAERAFILPGNHDVNIVDRANPARLDLPTSPGKRLRQMRMLSAMAAIQGERIRVLDPGRRRLGPTLSEALAPHRGTIASFADAGTLRLSARLSTLWADVFPMVLPPAPEDGLGLALLNSNAESHFSFTNALGLVAEEDMKSLLAVLRQFPKARWIIALHHHPVEYPAPAKALSERIGTALINGSRFVRQLKPHGDRLIAMHGHRHVDWIGRCGPMKIVSAPSPVMEATDDQPTSFYVHTLAAAADGGLALLEPQQIDIAPDTAPMVKSPAARDPSRASRTVAPAIGSMDAERRR